MTEAQRIKYLEEQVERLAHDGYYVDPCTGQQFRASDLYRESVGRGDDLARLRRELSNERAALEELRKKLSKMELWYESAFEALKDALEQISTDAQEIEDLKKNV